MQNNVINRKIVDEKLNACGIVDMEDATIRDIVKTVNMIEAESGTRFIRMEMGVPGLAPSQIGTDAEIEALRGGCAQFYPMLEGLPQLKTEGSKFVKNFVDVDIKPEGIIPTTGSMQACYAAFMAVTECVKGKDKVLFIDPGFPIQKSQLRIIGVEWEQFDIYHYRGEALRDKMESYLKRGDIAAIIYSNPNNPAWICLEDSELAIIGELATRYDAVVLEDMAYFCMDFRQDLGKPWQPPYPPTVAKYTDNYILMLSSSKIFSYAGQRMAAACVSDKLFDRHFPALAERYGDSGIFGQTFVASILYMITSGCTASTQYGYAEMLRAATDGELDFSADMREYARRAERMKKVFTDNGFHIVYDYDVTRPVGDGFFFTIGYGRMSGGELLRELLYYGVSSISLETTGSEQGGVRACTSRMREELYPVMEERMKAFRMDHPLDNA